MLPADHFVHRRGLYERRHPAVFALRNAVGGLFVLLGLAMLVLPGQGILTTIAGLTLMQFPGKRRLEMALARRSAVFRTLNWMRARRRQPPFLPPGEPEDGDDEDGEARD